MFKLKTKQNPYVINVLLIVVLCHVISIEDEFPCVCFELDVKFVWPLLSRNPHENLVVSLAFLIFTCATYGFYTSTSAEYDVYFVRDTNT